MASRDVSVPPARQWWTVLPFLLAVTGVAGLGGLAAAGSQAAWVCFATALNAGIVVLN